VVVYLVKEDYYLIPLREYSHYFSWFLFILFPVVLTGLSFFIVKELGAADLKKKSIVEIELANNNFLPTYLGYFFVSLGVSDIPTLIVVFLMIYVFTFLSQTLYFNPIFLLFGYHFYFLKTTDQVKIFFITKRQLKKPGDDGFSKLRRINDYTLIDIDETTDDT
jgi:hypothetical protein